ncbi:hypothetical protein GYMLUDRAFT_493486 [Collybiopsis luxurians FD-317 M1]|uniref:Secreted protein n=1 Tax=Collybiopsis luxurians FD-317 M1 TaxID=944289 RepID=A0A0D0C409_9AGAR|nr:hypothetical protein GYMLUDRAFT_493486 [Collybiopsis luxurians FD-317 M1]
MPCQIISDIILCSLLPLRPTTTAKEQPYRRATKYDQCLNCNPHNGVCRFNGFGGTSWKCWQKKKRGSCYLRSRYDCWAQLPQT